ncbi:hypothetical protein OOU_Y34scaffold00211g6 [Pyricularia oryzae Y34]|uniref:Uncharacterized protein n=3 Tax=Pyricularia oryzae TaxID=318829 RepID=A0A4P7NEL3_PYROR|nr:hypothetical protein OOU_Y34scaffold00211g6 [Pyricularia oryzae Y34]QBZ60281.1 hypothetical protein PoMZ_07220 [Pyricularia oryzae]
MNVGRSVILDCGKQGTHTATQGPARKNVADQERIVPEQRRHMVAD